MKNINTSRSVCAKVLFKLSLTAAALAFLGASPASAAARTWVGNSSTDWVTNANWNGSTVLTSGDSITFNAAGSQGATLTNTLTTTAFNVAGITFSATAPSYTIGGNSFNLTAGMTNSSGVLQTFNNTGVVAVSGSTGGTVLNNTGLTIATGTTTWNVGTGGISLSGLQWATTNTTSSTMTVNGTGGTLTIAYLGLGTMTNSRLAQTFNGTGNISVGTMVAGGSASLATDSFSYSGTGTFSLTGSHTDTFGDTISSGQFNLSGTLNAPLTVSGTANMTEASTGTLTGGNSFTMSSAGTATLSGVNTYTGTTTVNAGVLQLSGASGALALSATPIALNGGSLILDNTGVTSNNNNRIADTQTITLAGGNFIYKGSDQSATNSTETVGALSSGTGNSTITVTFGGTNGATLTAASLSHTAGNATDLVNGVNLGKNNTDTTSFARFISTAAPTLTGTGTAVVGGAGTVKNLKIVPFLVGESSSGLGTATGTANSFLTYVAGSGFRPLDTTNEFTQNATTTGNNIYITSATAASSNAINSLVINGNNLSIANGVTLTNTSGALLFASTNTIGTGGTTGIYTGSAENQITVNSGITGTISAIISGAQALTKSGAGTLVLSGANTSTGTTTLAGGTLNLSNQLALQSSVLQDNAGSVVFDATAGTAFTLGGLAGSGNIALQNSAVNPIALTLNVGSGVTASYSGVLSGTASSSLTKTGLGTQNLAGVNTYSGPTAVNGGILQLNSTTASIANSVVTVGSGAFLAFSSGNSGRTEGGQVSGVISGAGGIIDNQGNGNTTLTLDKANTYTGPTELTTRGLLTSTVAPTYDGSGNMISSGFGKDSALIFAAGLSANFGETVLLSTNSQFGSLSTNGATVAVAAGNGIVLNGFNLITGSDNTSTTWNAQISGGAIPNSATNATRNIGGNLTKIGSGTQTLGGANLYSGSTTITGGTLAVTTIANGGFLTTGTAAGATTTLTLADATGAVAGQNIQGSNLGIGSEVINSVSGNVITLNGNANAATNTPIAFGTANGLGISTNAAANLVLDGGTLQYTGAAASTDRLFTVGSNESGGATGTLDASGSGALIFSNTGAIAYGTTGQARTLGLTGNNIAANTLAPLIADNGVGVVSLLKSGAGSWTLTNANTYSGTTTISGGTLQLGDGTTGHDGTIANSLSIIDNGALVYNRFGSQSYGGVISGSGTVTKLGTGTQTLTGSNTYMGTTTITAGTLQIGDGVTSGAITASNITANSSLIIDNLAAMVDSGTLGGNGTVLQEGAGPVTFNSGNAGTNTFSGTLTDNTVVNLGTSNMAATIFLNGTNANPGTINYFGTTGSLTGNITVTTGTTGVINNTGGATLTLGTATSTISKDGSTLNLTSTGGGNQGSFNVAGHITGGTLGSDLNVIGAIVTLSNTNTYNGPTSIYGISTEPSNPGYNLIKAGIDAALPSGSVVTLGNASEGTSGYTNILDLNGFTQTIAGLSSVNDLHDTNYVVNGNGDYLGTTPTVTARTLTIAPTIGTTNTFGGVVGGGGTSANFGVSIAGPGTQVFIGNNTYTGGTTVTAGKLYVNNTTGSGTGTAAVTVGNGSANSGTLAGSGTIAGAVTVQSGGTLYSGSAQAQGYAGSATNTTGNVNPSIVSTGSGGGTGGGLTLSSNLAINASSSLTFALGNGASSGSTYDTPNTNSTYLNMVAGGGTVTFGTSGITINLVDLAASDTTHDSLQLRLQSPYLLIDAASNLDYNLITSLNGVLSVDGNGFVVGIGTSTSSFTAVASALTLQVLDPTNGNNITNSQNYGSPNGLQLYLDNGQLEVVPEPSTWAMMLGGLALLVVIQRRRSKSN